MSDLRVEIYHGGEFETKQGLYYYKGGTVHTLYDVDFTVLKIDSCLDYLREAGYGDGLKLYYKKSSCRSRDDFKLIWNDECLNEIREDAKTACMIEIYVYHCAEEKGIHIINEINFIDDGIELEDPDYEEEEYSESDQSEEESDTDEELEEIREKKRMLKKGLIDLLRDGNLTDMDVNNGRFNVMVEQSFDRDESHKIALLVYYLVLHLKSFAVPD
ncbi:hypothetical protein ACET3Z_025359 [Daucus carota]